MVKTRKNNLKINLIKNSIMNIKLTVKRLSFSKKNRNCKPYRKPIKTLLSYRNSNKTKNNSKNLNYSNLKKKSLSGNRSEKIDLKNWKTRT